jgi:hypothetical protein
MKALPARVRSKPLVLLGLPLVAVAAIAVALLAPGLGSARTSRAGEPTISGGTSVGDTLTGSPGTWASGAVSYKYNWRRCPPDGGQGSGNCDGIVDGPSNTYTLTGYEVGFTIRLQVKAWDSAGKKICIDGGQTCAVSSNATAQITGQGIGPTNTAPPTITGTAAVGQTLTASQGSWDSATSFLAEYSYDWLRCNTAGAACATFGAKAQTYVVTQADQGSTLRVRVTATNPAGTTQVNSAQTAVVPGGAAPPPPPPPPPGSSNAGCPSTRGTVQIAAVTSPLRLVVDRQIAGSLTRSSGQTISVRYHVSDTCGRSVQGALVYVTAVPFGQLSTPAEQATGATGYVSLTFQTLAGFPLGRNQRNVAIFVRARKQGEDLLAGVSTRRLFAIPISR